MKDDHETQMLQEISFRSFRFPSDDAPEIVIFFSYIIVMLPLIAA